MEILFFLLDIHVLLFHQQFSFKCDNSFAVVYSTLSLIRPLPPKTTFLIGPDFSYKEVVKYYSIVLFRRGPHTYKDTFSFQKGWPYKRGTIVNVTIGFQNIWYLICLATPGSRDYQFLWLKI
jgi:hypothetical protein